MIISFNMAIAIFQYILIEIIIFTDFVMHKLLFFSVFLFTSVFIHWRDPQKLIVSETLFKIFKLSELNVRCLKINQIKKLKNKIIKNIQYEIISNNYFLKIGNYSQGTN